MKSISDIPLGANLTEAQAYEIARQGSEAVVFALLQLAQRVGELERQLPGGQPARPSGMTPGYEKPTTKKRSKRLGRKKGPSWQSSASAGADRPTRGASAEVLSRLWDCSQKMPSHPHTIYRGHSRRPQGGSDRTYDISRLVSEVQEKRGADRFRGSAKLDFGQSRVGLDGLAALRLGQHALADHRSVQFPPADQAHARRADRSMAAFGGDFRNVVRTNSPTGERIRGVARRRDQLAGKRENALVVVFRGGESYLFYDRPLPGLSGIVEVLHSRVSRNFGERLLGRLQQGELRGGSCAWCTCCATL